MSSDGMESNGKFKNQFNVSGDGPPASAGASKYSKVPIEDFVLRRNIRFEVFVELGNGKYVRIAKSGQDIPLEKIRAFKRKGLLHLFLREPDYGKYMEEMSAGKRDILRLINGIVLERLCFSEVERGNFSEAVAIFEDAVEHCADSPQLSDLLHSLAAHDDHLFVHSLGVSLYAVMVALAVETPRPESLRNIALAGLFHDIGKKEIDRVLLMKPKGDYTTAEMKLYKSHVSRGAHILSAVPELPEEVIQIVSQHHENQTGSGFPSRLTKDRIHPLARIVAVANEFCALVLKSSHSEPSPADVALRHLLCDKAAQFDPGALHALARIFAMDAA